MVLPVSLFRFVLWLSIIPVWGFPCGLAVKNPPAMKETWVQSLGQEDPLEEGMATHFSTVAWRLPLTEEPGGAAIHRVAKSGTRLKSMSTNTQYSSVYMYHLDFIFLSMDILVDSMSWPL